ncbi:MAG TPA: hypothetical protein VNU72_09590 [Puia sp.]|nr:hypothetical protein [Puia sp.]
MLVCTRPSMSILYHSYQTTIAGLGNLDGAAIKELYTYVVDLDLLVCGPQYWFYSPPLSGVFTLEIALPVEGYIPAALLPHFRQLPPFKCLSNRYQGSWEGLPGAYAEMIKHIQDNGLSMSGVRAESFLHIDRSAPENNITEIQIGLF